MAAEHDVDLLVREQFFRNTNGGVLVEVGAAKPDYLSISASYRKLGWKIIAVEPNPKFCAFHRTSGFEVYEYAASDSEADNVPFYVVSQTDRPRYHEGNVSFESYSSLGIRGSYAESFETIKDRTEVETILVKVRKLDTILAKHEPDITSIDILTIDVEGWELNVMRGLTRFRPKVVILENLVDENEYVDYMKTRGYSRWRRLAPNDVYVRATPIARFLSELKARLRL